MDQLTNITIGTYQVSLAASYIQDKLQREGTEVFEIEMMHERDRVPISGLIRVQAYSRFSNAKKHKLWITYRPSVEQEGAELNNDNVNHEDTGILGYYCRCKSGARTIGACCHVTAVLWFLGYARHEEQVRYPPTTLIDTISDVASRE